MNKLLIFISIFLFIVIACLSLITIVPYQRFICEDHGWKSSLEGEEALAFCRFELERLFYLYETADRFLRNNNVSQADFAQFAEENYSKFGYYDFNPDMKIWQRKGDDIAVLLIIEHASSYIFKSRIIYIGLRADKSVFCILDSAENKSNGRWDQTDLVDMEDLELAAGNEQALCELLDLQYKVDKPVTELIKRCREECDAKIRENLEKKSSIMHEQ